MLKVGEVLSLQVDRPAAGGRMIARVDGQIVFVAGAIPGERVAARVTRVAKGVAYADCVSVEEASPDRQTAFTDTACGGSAYAYIDYPRQLAIKAEVVTDGLRRIGHLTPSAPVRVLGSQPDGYRMRARLHVHDGRAGFFREGSHQLCDPRSTRQLLPAACDVLDAIAALLRASRFDGIHELEIAENVDATARAVHLISTTPLEAAELPGFDAIAGLGGVSLTAPSRPGAVPDTHLVTGDPYVVDRLTIDGQPLVLRRHVRSFFQGNRHLLSALVSHVVSLVPPSQRVLDLYAGVGLFACAVAAARAATVTAVEGDTYAARDLAINLERLDRADAHHDAVESFLAKDRGRPDTVILDPPRTGVSPQALALLIARAIPRVVYVSCDVATLARDAKKLVESGYEMTQLDGFDLFPNTPHVETVMALVRR